MAQKDRTVLKTYFETSDKPSAVEFSDLIDSFVNFQDDSVLAAGSADGQFIFWEGTSWVHSSTSEFFWNNTNKNLGIGTSTPCVCAKVEIASTTQGFLLPKMTTAQRDAIASPVESLLIYNTTTRAVEIYSGSAWGVL